jgi:hypothetical protein
MIDIIEVLKQNKEEAKQILSKKENNTIRFCKWDEAEGEYIDADDAPWIRISGVEEIEIVLVVAVRYSKESNDIEIITTTDVYTKADNVWYSVEDWVDDISDWTIYDAIEMVILGEMESYED